ncbi:fk506-binding protein, putative [Entamoeba invadens IP1]|uniref:peptidylprolyl isomerase n=1 Tax=Entamoeba invadens IP1 TaxID=370355 RepID=A0A0A1TWS6_ENTIV|nr:fk506-binding protein, putative [Entamoeba invadens IP1]ELP85662.1 fk506-binding protein, putative [Entamoeba invadens IP1]|eukprot:XP_004185008.1 fk506-binding protein, putative [Entamoeba invadens IP1]
MDNKEILGSILEEVKSMRKELNELRLYVYKNVPQTNEEKAPAIVNEGEAEMRNENSQSLMNIIGQTQNMMSLNEKDNNKLQEQIIQCFLGGKQVERKDEKIEEKAQDEKLVVKIDEDEKVEKKEDKIDNAEKEKSVIPENVIECVFQRTHLHPTKCLFDTKVDKIVPSVFFAKTKNQKNVLIHVETKSGSFGSFHSLMPKEVMQDTFDGDKSLFIYSDSGKTTLFNPKRSADAIPTYFQDGSKNLFGIFYGFWLKKTMGFIIDGEIGNFFGAKTEFTEKEGDVTRITAWICGFHYVIQAEKMREEDTVRFDVGNGEVLSIIDEKVEGTFLEGKYEIEGSASEIFGKSLVKEKVGPNEKVTISFDVIEIGESVRLKTYDEQKEQVLKLKSRGKELIDTSSFEDAASVYESCCAILHTMLDDKRYQEHIEDIKKQLALIHSNLSLCFLKLDRLDETKEQSEEVLKFDKNNVKAFYRIGVVLNKKKSYPLALNYLKKALNLAKGDGLIQREYNVSANNIIRIAKEKK